MNLCYFICVNHNFWFVSYKATDNKKQNEVTKRPAAGTVLKIKIT